MFLESEMDILITSVPGMEDFLRRRPPRVHGGLGTTRGGLEAPGHWWVLDTQWLENIGEHSRWGANDVLVLFCRSNGEQQACE